MITEWSQGMGPWPSLSGSQMVARKPKTCPASGAPDPGETSPGKGVRPWQMQSGSYFTSS